jgi:long-chain acyl-CoA synthetase
MLLRNAETRPDSIGFVDEGRRFTWRETNERVNRIANALIGLGLQQGERVGILSRNCHQFLEIYFALAKAGLVGVAINARFMAAEVAHYLNDSGAAALFVHEDFNALARAALAEVSGLRHVIGISRKHDMDRDYEGIPVLDYEDLQFAAPPEEPERFVHEDDLFVLAYTSGTTGKPKGAMLTHRNSIAATTTMAFESRLLPHHRYLLGAAFYFASGGGSRFLPILRGCVTVLTNFEPGEVLRLIEQERITHTSMSPSGLTMLLEHPDLGKRDISSLEGILMTSAATPVPLLRRAIEKIGPKFMMGFGLSETGPSGLILQAEDVALDGSDTQLRRLGSIGRVMVGNRARIVDQEGKTLPPGEQGELVIRGACVMQGYWKDPEATAAALREGWILTGDLGTMDEDGYVYITDRRKDVIVSGGINVYPREVEEVLYGHPAILEAAVIGVPDERWGETVKAVVSLRPGQSITPSEIIAYCKERMASYKKPTSVDIWDALPKTGSNKIWKVPLREHYWKGHERRVN